MTLGEFLLAVKDIPSDADIIAWAPDDYWFYINSVQFVDGMVEIDGREKSK